MANERNTESIVRSHFQSDSAEIVIEEQQSKNPAINKLLLSASKAGKGKGYPEFIVQFKDRLPGFVVVVECKADFMKHESLSRTDYKGYAVDGALLYSSYLARDFDVLSIAVSGESLSELKVSHFLQLKGENVASPIAGNELLSMEDYEAAYLKSPEKFKQDYEQLISFSKDLNESLHTYKILESDRSLLLSCILIALSNEAFESSYAKYSVPEDLAEYLVQTVKNEFKRGKVGDKKLRILENRFGFITTDTSLSSEPNVLRDIIISIDQNINQFVRTHRYFDVLGQMYIEFLRYANSDKGLGIVLTPPHITEFMAELGEVNKDSVVYDSCTGTGGFLVSAMSLMIKDAKDDSVKIANIKQHQLVGVEYQANIFALACSNMFIHQDGKSSIINGSCFDEDVIDQVKSYHPTVGLLNPPYKSDKKKDIEELEFVLNNLECLEQGGKCVAIIPMSSALAQRGKIYELKKKILERHTLDAVFSMPDELFFNSKVGVVSCVMVFTAKRPHQSTRKTYFGYYKDDGFIKRKNKGRIDLFGEFSEKKKDLWIQAYQNREVIEGLSVYRTVTADDEWCAEAYMETDYSSLTQSQFVNEVVKYNAYRLLSGSVENITKAPLLSSPMSYEVNDWEFFNLTDLFKITGTKTTPAMELEEYGAGKFPYVTTQATNNGVEGFYNYSTEKGGVLTADSAVLGYCSYQEKDFSASDHVEKLIPKFNMSKYVALFLATVINGEQYRYNYGRKCSQTRLKGARIKLPARTDGQPDWDFMEDYIKSLPYSSSI